MEVRVRFAPSPTGYLHIGSARTALFNWLFARHYNGKFLLRVEDTDRVRSTQEATEAIFKSLNWLQLKWDEEPVFQFSKLSRHVEVAHKLLGEEKAYLCFCTPDDLKNMREEARKKGLPTKYNGTCRNRSASELPCGVQPTVRFKTPQQGETILHDLVQGKVTLKNNQLDDMILLRADGTPTYMLSVIVDDHDMGITHVIRGDDHLTNCFKQYHLYEAMGWHTPEFAHIPLIHGADGAKLSKRHGALGTYEYKEMGFLSKAMLNYLLRLGWSHGDDEIISVDQAIKWFNIKNIGRSPARFDETKLLHLNTHYMKNTPDDVLYGLIEENLIKKTGIEYPSHELKNRIILGLKGLKERSKTLVELVENSAFYWKQPNLTEKGMLLITEDAKFYLKEIYKNLNQLENFSHDNIQNCIKNTAKHLNIKVGSIAQPLRAAITGSHVSPSLFEIISIIGKKEILKRLDIFT